MTSNQNIEEIERLAKLRDSGAINEEEFAREKGKLLAGTKASPSFYRRLWVVVTLTCLLLTMPVALLILLTGNVYKQNGGSGLQPISTRARQIYGGILLLWLVAAGARSVWLRDGQNTETPQAAKAPATAEATPGRAESATPHATTTPTAPPRATGEAGTTDVYANGRYNYEITYRTDLLTAEAEAPNGDGRVFNSKDQSALVRVFGGYNALDQTPDDMEKDAAKDCVNPAAIMADATPTLVNVICEIPGQVIHFTRIVIKDDLLVTMDATYPKADQLIWNPALGRMGISLHVTQ